jgi:purine-nucleoside phosphorylase
VSIHIRPTAPLAERALLPADPGVALALAQALLAGPRMFNHNHGLWGYTGQAVDGRDLTIQSTGIGGASAAIVFEELVRLGLGRAVRVGTCTALPAGDAIPDRPARPDRGSDQASGKQPSAAPAIVAAPPGTPVGLEDLASTQIGLEDLASAQIGLGDLLIADAAVAADGTSLALGSDGLEPADRALTAALKAASTATRLGWVVSTDIFYGREHAEPSLGLGRTPPAGGRAAVDVAGTRPDDVGTRPLPRTRRDVSRAEPLAVDLESAALFALGRLRGVPVGCVLVVADLLLDGRRKRIDDAGLERASAQAGRLAAGGLGILPAAVGG